MNELEFPFEMPVTRYRMKKLPQSAGAKAQNSRQRMQRRNYQLGGTKKRSVFLPMPGKKSEPENSVVVESCAPKGKPRRKLKRGQPNSRSKLTAELSAKICGYVADGMSWQEAASMVGVHRNVISIWKAKGDADPQSEYGVFLKSAEEAELRREQVHLKFISQDKDWKARRWLLCNFRPEKYRMTSFSGELVGKDGLPLFPAAEKQFSVVLDVHAQPTNGEPVAEVFRIVKPDGSAELWQPNGERPPHS
jgi:hypothetical protein